MNKMGFTLVELLAVIIILGLISVIAVPSIMGINGGINEEMLEAKATLIEEAAIMYGSDFKGSIMASDKTYNNMPCKTIIVSDLVPTYLEKDNDNACLDKDSENKDGCIKNPGNTNDYLDQYQIIIYYKNKRIHAKMDIEKNLSCS